MPAIATGAAAARRRDAAPDGRRRRRRPRTSTAAPLPADCAADEEAREEEAQPVDVAAHRPHRAAAARARRHGLGAARRTRASPRPDPTPTSSRHRRPTPTPTPRPRRPTTVDVERVSVSTGMDCDGGDGESSTTPASRRVDCVGGDPAPTRRPGRQGLPRRARPATSPQAQRLTLTFYADQVAMPTPARPRRSRVPGRPRRGTVRSPGPATRARPARDRCSSYNFTATNGDVRETGSPPPRSDRTSAPRRSSPATTAGADAHRHLHRDLLGRYCRRARHPAHPAKAPRDRSTATPTPIPSTLTRRASTSALAASRLQAASVRLIRVPPRE